MCWLDASQHKQMHKAKGAHLGAGGADFIESEHTEREGPFILRVV